MNRIKISAVYIAKNEEQNIGKSLESLRNVVDEFVLVDTGSTDNTVNVFKAYGGKVFYLPWDNDFSAPRNYALSKATGDWVILLDADEYFSLETADNLRQVIEENCESNGLYLDIVNINKATGKALDNFYTLRAVRRQIGLGYHGRIHEELLLNGKPIADVKRVSPVLLTIIHTGYTPEISEFKCRRNLAILQQELADGYNPASLYTYLVECYDGIGDMANMLKYAWLDIEQGRRMTSYASRSYRKLINYYARYGTLEERIALVQRALADFPDLPEFHAELGLCFDKSGEYQKAVDELLLAVDMFINYQGIEPCLLDNDSVEMMLKHVDLLISKLS